jgi:hypothetical protein
MALHATEVTPLDALDEQIIELVGTATRPLGDGAALADTPAILALQLQLIDNFVEMVRMRTEIAERDARIASLTSGIRTWRDRAGIEQAARRRDAAEAREREREVVSLLHQQMQVADTAMGELERIRSRRWWRRMRG